MPPITRSTTRAARLHLDFSGVIDFTAAPATIPTIGDLDGSIHPIFRRANFDAGLNYDLFLPSLKLASKFITTPALLPFWYTTLFGDVRPAKFVVHARPERDCYEYDDIPSELTPEQVRQTQRALLHLRHRIQFRPPPADEEPAVGELASTLLENGWTVSIHVTTAAVAELAAAARKVEIGGELLFIGESFRMAQTLCHELAHAARLLVRGRGNYFHRGSPVCEDGWAWEEAIFGGQPRIIYLDASRHQAPASKLTGDCFTGTFWHPSPSSYHVASYVSADSSICIRLTQGEPPIPEDRDQDGKPLEFVGVSNLDLWEKVFTERFWKTEVKSRGVQALRLREPKSYPVKVVREDLSVLLRFYWGAMERLQKEMYTPAEKEELAKLCGPVVERSRMWDERA